MVTNKPTPWGVKKKIKLLEGLGISNIYRRTPSHRIRQNFGGWTRQTGAWVLLANSVKGRGKGAEPTGGVGWGLSGPRANWKQR